MHDNAQALGSLQALSQQCAVAETGGKAGGGGGAVSRQAEGWLRDGRPCVFDGRTPAMCSCPERLQEMCTDLRGHSDSGRLSHQLSGRHSISLSSGRESAAGFDHEPGQHSPNSPEETWCVEGEGRGLSGDELFQALSRTTHRACLPVSSGHVMATL